MSADQIHDTLQQRLLQLNDHDQLEIRSHIKVKSIFYFFCRVLHMLNVSKYCHSVVVTASVNQIHSINSANDICIYKSICIYIHLKRTMVMMMMMKSAM